MSGSKWADLGVRTASTVVLIPVVLGIVWLGSFWFTGLIVALGILMATEWVRISYGNNKIQLLIHEVAAASLIMGSLKLSLLALLILTAVSWFVRRKDDFNFFKLVGVFYIGLPILAFDVLRSDTAFGFLAVVWCMMIVWSADINTITTFRGVLVFDAVTAVVVATAYKPLKNALPIFRIGDTRLTAFTVDRKNVVPGDSAPVRIAVCNACPTLDERENAFNAWPVPAYKVAFRFSRNPRPIIVADRHKILRARE